MKVSISQYFHTAKDVFVRCWVDVVCTIFSFLLTLYHLKIVDALES